VVVQGMKIANGSCSDRSDAMGKFKNKKLLAYLSLDLIYDLKGYCQKHFRENAPLTNQSRLPLYDFSMHLQP
jgi:hypothetical protein